MKLGYLLIAAFSISLGVIIFGEGGLIPAFRFSQEKVQLEQRIRKLEEDNQDLRRQIRSFETDSAFQEYTIRKSLSLVGEDEILFEFQ